MLINLYKFHKMHIYILRWFKVDFQNVYNLFLSSRSQVKLRVNALEKVIAEQQTPGVRITRTKSRLNKNKENIDQQLNSGQKLNGVPAKSQLPKLANTKLPSASKLTALTAKKFNSSKNCTPHVIRTARTVMKSTQKNVSTEKDDSLKKQREEEARKKKEQMLLEKLEEKRRYDV